MNSIQLLVCFVSLMAPSISADPTQMSSKKSYKSELSKNSPLLSHVESVKAIKGREYQKGQEEFEKKWTLFFKGKTLDELKEHLKKTITGSRLISESESLKKSIDDSLATIVTQRTPIPDVINKGFEEETSQEARKHMPNDVLFSGQTEQLIWLREREIHRILERNKREEEYLDKITKKWIEDQGSKEQKRLYALSRKWIENEIKYSDDYIVLYHASKGTIRFLYDVITEFFNVLSMTSSHGLLKLRSEESDFGINIDQYMDKFANEKKGDHSDFGRQTQISTNFSFLEGNPAESALAFFMSDSNISDNSAAALRSFLKSKLKDDHLVDQRYAKYMELAGTILHQGASMLQIAIKKDHVNSLAYLSKPGGIPIFWVRDESNDKLRLDSRSQEWKKIRNEMFNKSSDKEVSLVSINTYISQFLDPLNPDRSYFNEIQKNTEIQARLLMKEDFFNPNFVKMHIVTYADLPAEEIASYRQKLRVLVQEDVAYYLAHTPKDETGKHKLDTFKDFVDKGQEFKDSLPPPILPKSKEYQDDEPYKGVGKVVG